MIWGGSINDIVTWPINISYTYITLLTYHCIPLATVNTQHIQTQNNQCLEHSKSTPRTPFQDLQQIQICAPEPRWHVLCHMHSGRSDILKRPPIPSTSLCRSSVLAQ
ncbi:hypothetical protein EJ05DRAFT_398452 [Pseudovirgaria hyperparasitica]|uniref:Uncharacterized protein n=1 Tax=Pseudovirgaria hyperparasitica TaxID=470096 RepID=A0A6A6W6R5_9PEZI|nr:uncharacterized protein EJ05DRAFT_398452 [Pseudovirgaria hyperparasitica]KAF2757724.1 hypothetical protein EJ05DRAFT_398452 [Pseudovirgaria hyperparasitica]